MIKTIYICKQLVLSMLVLIPIASLTAPSAVNAGSLREKYAKVQKVGTPYEACSNWLASYKLWIKAKKDKSRNWKPQDIEMLRRLTSDKQYIIYKHMGITYEMMMNNHIEEPNKTIKIMRAYCVQEIRNQY